MKKVSKKEFFLLLIFLNQIKIIFLKRKKHLLLLRFPETILFSKTKVEWVELREKNDSLGFSKSQKSRKRC